MVVANLAEAAAEAVGANALLARVGAYYHDIGKLIRPMYFKENQMGENPHDKTDPRVSTAILTEHTRDGVELARKHRLPEPIIDMIRQHHGDTPVMYFYAKAVKMLGEENVDIRDFRYDGPKPQTAEAAILMLSDTVEAAVRAHARADAGEDLRADSQAGARQNGGRPAGRMYADLPRYRQNLLGV
ncbi:MAG: HDIG domain-containing metalloprotein [Christensenellales bacterium]